MDQIINQAPLTVDGHFVRKPSSFRNAVTADGSSGFPAESNRYHLYVSYACPWAHRTLVVLKLKGLEKHIGVTVVDWYNAEGGWKFNESRRGCTADTVNHKASLKEIYLMVEPEYAGNFTVPVLFDRVKKTIVNNESSEIIRFLNSEFNAFCETEAQRKLDLYPEDLRGQIDAVNEWIYTDINNGVYRAGFARTQQAYDEAFDKLFAALDRVEDILAKQRYLTGTRFTEADVRLWTTLVRFDAVYVQHFKCNLKRLVDYPNLQNFLKEIHQTANIHETVDMEHIKNHYIQSHKIINPLGIVPKGPLLDFDSPHDRSRLPGTPLF